MEGELPRGLMAVVGSGVEGLGLGSRGRSSPSGERVFVVLFALPQGSFPHVFA